MKNFLKKLDYKLVILLIIIFIGIILSVCLPRVEDADKIVIEINKKDCEVSLLDKDRLIAKLRSRDKNCKIYILNQD
mgnify:CR=1 FL=1|tara:strand:- start:232 stop:462 length:231 start_codon:yes stop_codon:yes gene_type:complete